MHLRRFFAALLCPVLAASLLTGCMESQAPSAPPATPSETEAMPTEAETVPPETIAPTEAPLTTVGYTVQRQDHSRTNEADGKILHYYDQIVITENTPQTDAINALIAQDCQAFLDDFSPEDYEEILRDPFLSDGTVFENTADAVVTNNADGIFSILLSYSWFMGGVANFDFHGMTFDLTTGKAMTLADFAPQDPDAFLRDLKDLVWDYLTEKAYGNEMFPEARETLDAYSLEEMDFHIDSGEIILTFPTYTFAPGAAGPVMVSTGIRVGQ